MKALLTFLLCKVGTAHTCFDQKFPVSYGGGETQDAIGGYSYDASGNNYLCGRTKDEDWAQVQDGRLSPFVIKTNWRGYAQWQKYYVWKNTNESMSSNMNCQMSEDSNYLVLAAEFD